MYTSIKHPSNGRTFSVHSIQGVKIIRNYINFLKGGSKLTQLKKELREIQKQEKILINKIRQIQLGGEVKVEGEVVKVCLPEKAKVAELQECITTCRTENPNAEGKLDTCLVDARLVARRAWYKKQAEEKAAKEASAEGLTYSESPADDALRLAKIRRDTAAARGPRRMFKKNLRKFRTAREDAQRDILDLPDLGKLDNNNNEEDSGNNKFK